MSSIFDTDIRSFLSNYQNISTIYIGELRLFPNAFEALKRTEEFSLFDIHIMHNPVQLVVDNFDNRIDNRLISSRTEEFTKETIGNFIAENFFKPLYLFSIRYIETPLPNYETSVVLEIRYA